jgi:hypothetical protein
VSHLLPLPPLVVVGIQEVVTTVHQIVVTLAGVVAAVLRAGVSLAEALQTSRQGRSAKSV